MPCHPSYRTAFLPFVSCTASSKPFRIVATVTTLFHIVRFIVRELRLSTAIKSWEGYVPRGVLLVTICIAIVYVWIHLLRSVYAVAVSAILASYIYVEFWYTRQLVALSPWWNGLKIGRNSLHCSSWRSVLLINIVWYVHTIFPYALKDISW